MKNLKSNVEIKRDLKALELVLDMSDNNRLKNRNNRFYIKNKKYENKPDTIIVWDNKKNEEVHNFGTVDYYAGILTTYAQLPCNFDLN